MTSSMKNVFFDPSALRINDSTPVKVTFLHAQPGTEHHLIGFYTFDNNQFKDIRILFSNVHNEVLNPNVSSVFLGNRLNGKTPVFFMIENGFSLNSSFPWFSDAVSGKNGNWMFLEHPADETLMPVLERGAPVWKNPQGITVETAIEAQTGSPRPVLIWHSNDGHLYKINGTLYHSYGYGFMPDLNPDEDKHALLILEEATSSVILNFAGKNTDLLETSPNVSLRLQIGERNFSALTKNRIGCAVALTLASGTTVTEMSVKIPVDSENALYIEGFEDHTTIPLARRTFHIVNEKTKLTISAEAPAAVYEAICTQIKIKAASQEQTESPVTVTLQTSRGEIIRTGTITIAPEGSLTSTLFSSILSTSEKEPETKSKLQHIVSDSLEKLNDPVPSFLVSAPEEKSSAISSKKSSRLMAKPYSQGKTVLITGGAKRIGREIALNLAREGWDVLIHCNTSVIEASRLCEELQQKFGIKSAYIRANLENIIEARELISSAVKTYGPIDVLVNNASVFDIDDVFSCTPETWHKNMTVNLQAPFFLSQAFASELPKDRAGIIINILDQRVLNPTPYFTSYTISKSALATLTQTLALALAPNIRVNGIAPGDVIPAMTQSKSDFERRQNETPLKRGPTAEEISSAVSFIISSSGMTGQIIALDGGQHLNWAPEKKDKNRFG